MTGPRIASKEVREVASLMQPLGYKFVRANGGHLVYEHDEQPAISLASTPSDFRWRDNVLAELRRRHPDAFTQRKATAEVRARRRAYRKPAVRQSIIRSLPAPVAVEGEPVEVVPDPGSRDAKARGCLCPAEQSRYGGTGDGLFAIVKGCPLHDDEPQPDPALEPSIPQLTKEDAPVDNTGSPDVVQTLTARRDAVAAELEALLEIPPRITELKGEVARLNRAIAALTGASRSRGRPKGSGNSPGRLLAAIEGTPGLNATELGRELGYAGSTYLYKKHMLPDFEARGVIERREDGGWYPTGKAA